jgi:antitoxin component of RelBE/YafQ-DinJ toxin-antitoxin module
MPNKPATANRTIRIDETLWANAGAVAKAHGTDRATVIKAFLRWYIAEDGAELPDRATRREETS